MTIDQKISLASAIIAFLSMIGAIVFSIKASRSSKKANEIAIGQAETALREQISIARQRMEDIGLEIQKFLKGRDRAQLSTEEDNYLSFLEKTWNSSVENYLNAYEDACGKYIDGKIDRIRFKKIYIEEIRNICDPKRNSYKGHMHPKATSKFEAIWKVYEEWHRHEK